MVQPLAAAWWYVLNPRRELTEEIGNIYLASAGIPTNATVWPLLDAHETYAPHCLSRSTKTRRTTERRTDYAESRGSGIG